MKKFLSVLLTLLVMLGVGCAAAESAGEITLLVDPLLVPVGEYKNIRYEASPSALERAGFTFESSDPDMLYVSYIGQVKGLAAGECTVTITSVKDPNVTALLTVQVINPVEQIRVSVEKDELVIGETTQLSYECRPEEASIKEATFKSNKESVATVDENGVITAVGRGTATISVISRDGAARNSVKVTVKALPTEVRFKNSEYTLALGKTIKFAATVRPSNADDKRLIWSSSDESIATVNSSGTVRAHSAGVVTITAACKADPTVSGSVQVNCVQPIQSIKLAEDAFDLLEGETAQLKPAFTPADATVSAIKYTSSNISVCTVDQNGLVTAVGSGTAKVTVSSLENSSRKASATVNVYVPVQGVTAQPEYVTVGVGQHAYGNVKMIPTDATRRTMTWESSDPSVAYVTNNTNRPRIVGSKWGSCELTGTTDEGGFTTRLTVYVGLPYEALAVESAVERDGQLYVTVRNASAMHMTGVRIAVWQAGETELIPVDIAPGAVSPEIPVGLTGIGAAVSGWESDTGWYNNRGEQYHSYRLSSGMYLWYVLD